MLARKNKVEHESQVPSRETRPTSTSTTTTTTMRTRTEVREHETNELGALWRRKQRKGSINSDNLNKDSSDTLSRSRAQQQQRQQQEQQQQQQQQRPIFSISRMTQMARVSFLSPKSLELVYFPLVKREKTEHKKNEL